MTVAEYYIGKAPDSYRKDLSVTLGAGKFHNIANDKN